MELNLCKICKKAFTSKQVSRTCPECNKLDDACFTRVEEYLKAYPNSNAMQIAEALDIPIEVVVSYITEGRLQFSKGVFEQIQ